MGSNYSVLAKYYDRFTQNDCDYVSWSQYLYRVGKDCGAKEVVDIACGTGKMTKLLVEQGLKAIGIDDSVEMLNVARTKCKAVFVKQDMRSLELPHPVDMAVCVNDGVNYLKPSELSGFFKRVSSSLKAGAPFVFDVSSPYKLQTVIGNNVFYLDEEKETLLWSNVLAENCVEMNLTLFVDDGNGKYVRFDEQHTQYVHTDEQIVAALESADFELREITADYGQSVAENSLRRCYYAQKTK
ncbi:MAG: methyltransferase domain-containing protein [Clostridiales bacterium]|nr:methyltransferase domain-containing protein [Clostridiales bacterium]